VVFVCEVAVNKRPAIAILVLLCALSATGKSKKKDTLPELILRARYVAVVVDPDAGISLDHPSENQTAQNDVQAALQKWGRFKVMYDPQNVDLILVLHKGGQRPKPTIGGGPIYTPPQVGTNGDVNVGIGVGRRPPLSSTEENRLPNPSPRMEIGSGDDIFSVYRGGGQYPLDAPPLWRYSARNALQHPSVPAIDKFRKAIEEAEKAKP